MKVAAIVTCLVLTLATGCQSHREWLAPTPDGKAVESAILWKAKLTDKWLPVEMQTVVENEQLFEKEGNFYKAKGECVVFGHPATYVGMLGIDLCAGPNALLTGSPESVAAYLTEKHGVKFKAEGGVLVADYRKDIKILVVRHPDIKGSTIVIGAYTGP